MTQYAWQNPGFFGELEAQAAGEHLESLVEKFDEHLTADEILADARRTHSPLHGVFLWRDDEAAEKQRMQTARRIINSLVVKSKKGARRKTRAFVFVHMPKHGRKCYVPVRSAMARPELKQQVIEQAYKRLEQWIGAYGGDRAFRTIAKDVERLRRKIEIEYLTAAGMTL